MPLQAGLYAVVRILSMRMSRHRSAINALSNSGPRSLSSRKGHPYLMNTLSQSVRATIGAVCRRNANASTHLVKWSCTVNIHEKPSRLVGCGPVMSMETSSHGSPHAIGWRGVRCDTFPRLYLVHSTQAARTRRTSADHPTQYARDLIAFSVRVRHITQRARYHRLQRHDIRIYLIMLTIQ